MAATYNFRHEQNESRNLPTVKTVHPEWAAALEAQWAKVQKDGSIPVVDLAGPVEANEHLAQAKVWGMNRLPEKVVVRKSRVRRDEDKPGTLRLNMTKHVQESAKAE